MLLDSSDLDWLARLARALLKRSHEADDLVQETVLAALEGPPPPDAPRRAWLGSVARRLAARRFRSESRRQRRERRAAVPEALPDSAELVARVEAAERLTAAVRRLPEPFRRTILLRFLEGLSPEDIARQDGKPVDTVRWRIRRGLELLREGLDRTTDSGREAWVSLLVPLANSRLEAGRATAGAAKTLTSSVAVGVMMQVGKWATAALITVIFGGLVWWSATALPKGEEVASSTPAEVSAPPIDEAPGEPVQERSEEVAATDESLVVDATEAVAAEVTPAPFGIVVDEGNAPVVGATVFFLAESDGEDSESPEPLDPVQTNGSGEFFLTPPEGEFVDLGVVANGFLSQTIFDVTTGASSEADDTKSASPLRIVLERGLTLSGRVVDEKGSPVPGLRLLAHTPGRASVDHVSPSQVSLRGDRAALKNVSNQYHQCRARTDQSGAVDFSGLPDEELVVRALDPGWTIDASTPVRPNEGTVEWTARRRLGVRVVVIDSRTSQPVERASATFNMRLTFADGVEQPLGQYVGRGVGEVSFALDPETMFLPAHKGKTVTRIVFHGTVESGTATKNWEAPALEDPEGVTGVATTRVRLEPVRMQPREVAVDGSHPSASPKDSPKFEAVDDYSTVVLRVQYPDKSRFRGRLVARWSSKLADGNVRKGKARIKPSRWDDYEFEVVPGTVSLQVYEYAASGSLPPATLELECAPYDSQIASVTLPQGGAVSIERPYDWSGPWLVHASWRPVGDTEGWRGSWNHGTDRPTLEIAALHPAEWRFQLRRKEGDDPIVRTVVVREGFTESVRE